MTTILFMEDQPDTIENFVALAESLGFETITRATPTEMIDVLNDQPGTPGAPPSKIAGVVFDIMLFVHNSEHYTGVIDGPTAGFALAKKMFAGDDATWPDLPFCFLSRLEERAEDIDRVIKTIKLRNDEIPQYIYKYAFNSEEVFSKWLGSLTQ